MTKIFKRLWCLKRKAWNMKNENDRSTLRKGQSSFNFPV
uniref:Uncharacterized protein n=1 Tax=Anguilla anguilla TaxID=7936 RepID=A0A0E9U2P4_ANGAN